MSPTTQVTKNKITLNCLKCSYTAFLFILMKIPIKKNDIKEQCEKSFENKLCVTLCRSTKNYLWFYKTSANEIYPFINSKVFYFKHHFACEVQQSLTLNVLKLCQTKLAVEAMTEPLHIKRRLQKSDILVYFKRQIYDERNQLVGLITDQVQTFFESELVQLNIYCHTK